MREILFRGKRLDNGEWVEGYVYRFHPICRIRHWLSLLGKYGDADVAPATIGQYTGLTDKHGKRIFEGDIVKNFDYTMVVVWYEEHASFALAFSVDGNYYETISKADTYLEIIGNIHDNPELIGGGE